jgi:hypothetical protein
MSVLEINYVRDGKTNSRWRRLFKLQMKTPKKDTNPELEEKMAAFRLKFEIKLAESKKTVFEELMPFLVAMGSEGERSAVVLGAERINVAVEALLKTFLLPSQNRTDNLFSTDGALATFSRKIEMAYRLGLLDSDFKQALGLVRKLRNDFAHATRVETLEEPTHADKVKALEQLISAGNQRESLAELKLVFKKAVGAREQTCSYLSCVMLLLLKLEMTRHHIERPEVLMPAMLNYKKTH